MFHMHCLAMTALQRGIINTDLPPTQFKAALQMLQQEWSRIQVGLI